MSNKSEELVNLKGIYKTTLVNGVTLYILPDSFLDFDVSIKFDNYGSNLDKYYHIFGFQHLLEHCIFFKYNNLNVISNASTTPNFMALYFNVNEKNFDLKHILNYWLFTNNDYTKINLSRNLSIEEIKHYINELDNEHDYRKILNVPWDLQTLVLSNGKAHYFGGNKYTFENKEKSIQKNLLKPLPVAPEEIVIFIKKSKSFVYNDLKNIFNNLVKVKKKHILYNIDTDFFYNKVIQINSYDTNSLIFLVNGETINSNFLYFFRLLYPFMNFELISHTNYYYICFNFLDINALYIFYYILQVKNYDLLRLDGYRRPIRLSLDIFNLEKYPVEILNLSHETFANIFNKYKIEIFYFFNLFTEMIERKQFIVNTTKGYLFNHETTKTLEKYYITNANFLDDYFYSYHFNNFNIIHDIDNILLSNSSNFQNIYCKSVCNIIYASKKKNLIYSNSILYKYIEHNKNYFNEKYLKLDFGSYIYFLILYFTNSTFLTLDECIKDILTNNTKIYLKSTNEHEIVLSNSTFKIKCEYDFFFLVIKLSQKEVKEENYIVSNLELYLKKKGLCYYLASSLVRFKKFGLLFIYSNVKSRNFKIILENILFFIQSNYLNINTDIVLSYKNKLKDFSELKKSVKCTF